MPEHEIVLGQPDEPVIVYGDPLRIEQVLGNLLSNAIKFPTVELKQQTRHSL